MVEAGAQGTLPSAAGTQLRIASVLPNPPGNDDENEEVTIRNEGRMSINLAGWRLRDLADNLWSLDRAGRLAAGQQIVLRRLRQPLSLNNGGDRVELLNPAGAVVDSLEYGPVGEGEVVLAQPR